MTILCLGGFLKDMKKRQDESVNYCIENIGDILLSFVSFFVFVSGLSFYQFSLKHQNVTHIHNTLGVLGYLDS